MVSIMKEELGETRASSEKSPQRFKLVLWEKAQEFRNAELGKERELNEEPQFSLTVICLSEV